MKDFLICSGAFIVMMAIGAFGGLIGIAIMFGVWLYITAEYLGSK